MQRIDGMQHVQRKGQGKGALAGWLRDPSAPSRGPPCSHDVCVNAGGPRVCVCVYGAGGQNIGPATYPSPHHARHPPPAQLARFRLLKLVVLLMLLHEAHACFAIASFGAEGGKCDG